MRDGIGSTLVDTRMEADIPELLWSLVNLFHSAIDRAQRQLDGNEDRERTSRDQQDGSEVRSVELERLTAEGISLTERRNTFEFLRDAASDQY